MKTKPLAKQLVATASVCILAALITGCATSQTASPNSTSPYKFRATDGRIIVIGQSSMADGGKQFRNPHLEKCWVADGFDFNGYDTLYVAPTLSTAKFHADEERPHALAKENLVIELKRELESRGVFTNIVMQEAEIKPGARVLKLENTITEYTKGGGAARYWVGLYGGGQPALRVVGRLTGEEKELFTYQARRSGVSAGARMGGAWMKDEDIQIQDIRSMTLDLADFVAAVAGKYQPVR